MDATRMRDFWDERAREDPFHFVDDRQPYRQADADRFWAEGERDLDTFLGLLDLRVAAGDRVLDLGCGVGRLTRVLAARARHVTALDVSPEMLERGRRLNPGLTNVAWVLGDGRSLAGVEDATHDLVVSHVVLQHIPETDVQLGYLAEFARVLRPGGHAAFGLSTDPGVHRAGEQVGARRGLLRRRRDPVPAGKAEPEWLGSAVPVDALEQAVAAGGLRLERLEGAGTQFTYVRAAR